MASTESFDELERKLSEQIERALNEIREEFLERLQGATGRLEEMLGAEMAAARDEASTLAAAEADEVRAAILAEAEEAKAAAIAEAIQAKEAEFREILEGKDATLAELEAAREAAVAEVHQAREAAFAEVEEAKVAAIGEALAAKEAEFREILVAKDQAIAAAEATRTGAVDAAILALHERVAAIDSSRSQSEVLAALLAASAQHAARSMLFLTREDGLQGWGAQGFDSDESTIQSWHLDYSQGSAWAALAEGRGTVELGADSCAELCRGIDGSQPQAGVLIPLVLRDRLAATLYADRLADDDPLQTQVLQLFTYIAGQALETLPMRQHSSTITLHMYGGAAAEEPGLELWQYLTPEEAPVEQEPIPVEVPAEVTAAERAVEDAVVEPELPAAEPEYGVPEPSDYMAAEETGFTVEDEIIAPEPGMEPVAEMPVAESQAPAEFEPPTRVAPPAAAGAEVAPPEDIEGPGWAFTTRRFGEGSDEDASHEEARRLARLLVTEIKLYNEEQVEEGRRGRNIYRTLRDDIDRSRQIYEERIDDGVRTSSDYFREELVRILAGGDEEVMGM